MAITGTMTPSYYRSSLTNTRVFRVAPNGLLNPFWPVTSYYGARPVINIRSDVLIQEGDGTIENPFILNLA